MPTRQTERSIRRNHDLVVQYDLAQALLTSALDHAHIGQPAKRGDQTDIRKIHEKLTQPEPGSESIATYTGALFFAIVALTGNRRAMDLIRGSNERLFPLRQVECQYLEDVANELIVLCELALAGRQADLKDAIIAYHERRRDLLHKPFGYFAA